MTSGGLARPVRAPPLQGPFGQGYRAVFAPWASSDPDQHPLRVKVRDPQRRPFRQAPSTGLDQPQTPPGGRVVDQGQQGADLLRTPHERQLLALAGAHEPQDWPRSLARQLVEEFDPGAREAEGALGDLLLVEQEEAGRAELRFAELVGSAPVVVSPLVNGLDRTLWGPGGEPPPLQVVAHPVSEGSHRHPPVRVGHEPSPRVYTNRQRRGHSAVRTRERKQGHRQERREPYRVAVSFNY